MKPAPPDLVLRFALAVAQQGSMATFILPTNRRAASVTIEEAASSGNAFMVEVRPKILAADADKPEQVLAAATLLDELKAKGLVPMVLESGGLGRRHVFCRIADADMMAAAEQRARHLGLDVRRHIRPPLSPHRQGRPVVLLEPSDPRAALAALEATEPVLVTDDLERRPLSERMAYLLRDGDGAGHYHSRSEADMAIALAARNADWTEDEFKEAMLDPPCSSGPVPSSFCPRRV